MATGPRGTGEAGLAVGAVAGTGAWRAAPGKDRPLLRPGSLPYPHLPAGTDTIPQIEHIVVLMMENSIGQIDDFPPALTDYPANGTIFR